MMGLFSFIITKNKNTRKNTNDIEYDKIKASVDEYIARLERYKFLKNSEISNIPDVDLEDSVMSWIWNKFNKEWSNQYKIIESLPKPCQDVYSCRTVYDEVNNGGFNQLFFNSTRQFTDMACKGFNALGAVKLSDITKNAIEIYNQNKLVLVKYKDGTMEGFYNSNSDKFFDSLDDSFYEECKTCDISNLFIKYIKKNSEYFGD